MQGHRPYTFSNRLAPHRLDNLRYVGLEIELALVLTTGANSTFVDGLQELIVPRKLTAQYTSSKRDLTFGSHKAFEPEFGP